MRSYELTLSYNDIDSEALKLLLALRNVPSVKMLKFHGNDFSKTQERKLKDAFGEYVTSPTLPALVAVS